MIGGISVYMVMWIYWCVDMGGCGYGRVWICQDCNI